jgi:hypothetical protein
MSLKAFHLFFITLSVLLALGCGVWTAQLYQSGGNPIDLAFAVASFAAAVGLVVYGAWFIRKARKIIV